MHVRTAEALLDPLVLLSISVVRSKWWAGALLSLFSPAFVLLAAGTVSPSLAAVAFIIYDGKVGTGVDFLSVVLGT